MRPGFVDIQGTIEFDENPLSSARNNHIDLGFHVVRELLCTKINIQFLASEEQHADNLTKYLAATHFENHRRFSLNLPLAGEKGCELKSGEYRLSEAGNSFVRSPFHATLRGMGESSVA